MNCHICKHSINNHSHEWMGCNGDDNAGSCFCELLPSDIVAPLEKKNELSQRLIDYCRMALSTGDVSIKSIIAIPFRDVVERFGYQNPSTSLCDEMTEIFIKFDEIGIEFNLAASLGRDNDNKTNK